MPSLRSALMTMGIGASSFLWTPNAHSKSVSPARMAIYYGYPSLVNGAQGNVEKAAGVFSAYDVVVLGDGLEFADEQPGRYPQGDPEEHQKVLQIIAAVRRNNPAVRFYGYVCLGEIPWPKGQQTALSPIEIEERMQLWKQMGVCGIFLDGAGYDYPVVTRERQNLVVRMIHDMGLSAFMNAYFLDHLFGVENKPANANGLGKNPDHLAPLLDHRDLFLLESFQIKNGAYATPDVALARLKQALALRKRYGTHIFATTTTTAQQSFSPEKLNFAWWTARIYGLDGFSWGEPNFAAQSNTLPDRQCAGESGMLTTFDFSSFVGSDGMYISRKAGPFVVAVDTGALSVRRISAARSVEPKEIPVLLRVSAPAPSPLTCEGTAV